MSQKAKIQQFKSITGANDSVAKTVLSGQSWDVNRAMDYYFNNRHKFPSAAVKKTNPANIEKLFDKYAKGSSDEDAIFDDDETEHVDDPGMTNFCSDIGVDMESILPMALGWKLAAAEMGAFSREEFMKGWSKLGCDTIKSMKSYVSELKKELGHNQSSFKNFYRWVFDLSKVKEERKTIDKEDALPLWDALLSERWQLCQDWLNFANGEKWTTVNRDLWNMILDFSVEVKPDLSNWEDDGAWPGAIDDFVVVVQETLGK